MIKPLQTSDIADHIANQSWHLLKPHLDLQFSRLGSLQPHSKGAEVSIKNQSISHLLAKILPETLLSNNQNPNEAMSSAKINQVILSYKNANMQNTHSLKSIYMIDKITRYFPLISKLPSLHLPLFQAPQEGFFLQSNVVVASFPFPNAPISSEYFKFFELFQKRQLPSQKKSKKNKKSRVQSKQTRDLN
jgi:hypothetical protein